MNGLVRLYREAYSGLSRKTWLLSLVMFVNRAGTMVVPFMSLYLTQRLGFSLERAGIVLAVFGAGSVAGGFLGGSLTDRFGFYRIQVLTLMGGGLLFILLGQLTTFRDICICSFVLSMINDAFRPANASAIAHYSAPENRTRSYSLNRLAINLGWAFGGALGGFIAAYDYNALFWIDGTTNLVAALLLLLVLPYRSFVAAAAAEPAGAEKPFRFQAYKDKVYLVFIGLVVLFAFSFFQIFTTLPVYLKQELLLSEAQIGALMALNGILICLFEMVVIYRLEGRRHALHFIPIGTLIVAVSFAVYNFIPGALLVGIVSELLVTGGEILSMPFMNSFWISRTSAGNRGQYAGLYTIAWSLAQVLAPFVGTRISSNYGFPALWWIIAGICLCCSIGFAAMNFVRLRKAVA